jgi:hypothetical protein
MVNAIKNNRATHKSWIRMVNVPIVGLLWSLAVVWLNVEKLAIVGAQPIQHLYM